MYNNLLFNASQSFLHGKRTEGQAQQRLAFQERAQREASFVRKLRNKHMKDLDAEIKQQIPAACYRLPTHHEAKKPTYRKIRRCCSYGVIAEPSEPQQLRVVADCLQCGD